jgi:hypothetical protein
MAPSPALSHLRQRAGLWSKRSSSGPLFLSDSQRGAGNTREGDADEAVLTDLDARVLQKMLQDEKLNLQEEDNMKRLLERGVKNNEPVAQEAKRAKEEAQVDQEYSSRIFQTLGNTKLWKGLSRNAADLFESAKIWVENKVERDAKLVASLGIFAFDRALQDVKRALPAASSAAQKVAPKLLLDTTTSANEDQDQNASSADIRNRMTTPQDEIQSVAQEIKLIIQSGGERRGQGSTGGDARGLQSAATSRRGKDRFLKAYQRRKETTLRREKENFAQTSARMAGSVMDSAYQVQRDLQVEPNQPGYKSKALREGAAQTSKFLASGAKGFLSGAKAAAQAALPATEKSTRGPRGLPNSTSSSPLSGGMEATDAAMDAAMGSVSPNKKKTMTPFIDATIVDAAVVDVQRPSIPEQPTRPQTVSDAPINARIPGTSSTFYASPATSDTGSLYGAPPVPPDTIDFTTSSALPDDLDEEELFFASREAPDFQQKERTIPSLLNDEMRTENRPTASDGSKFSYFSRDPAQDVSPEVVEAVWDAQQARASSSRATASSSEPDPTTYTGDVLLDDEDFLLDDEDPQDTLRRVMAEIVSDEDFDDAVGQAKRVDNTADQEVDDAEEEKPSFLSVIVLRLLDILFLVLEKVILVSGQAASLMEMFCRKFDLFLLTFFIFGFPIGCSYRLYQAYFRHFLGLLHVLPSSRMKGEGLKAGKQYQMPKEATDDTSRSATGKSTTKDGDCDTDEPTIFY